MTKIKRVAIMFAILSGVALVAGVVITFATGKLIYNYPEVKEDLRSEELAFWATAKRLSLEDRSALLNYSERTGELPRVLPWWEYDNAMCSATVTKYINLFTGVPLVHSSAWTIRTHRLNPGWVSNDRKLTTVWDKTDEFDADGRLEPDVKKKLISEVENYPFEWDQIYVLGLLWENTGYMEKIQEDGQDINSHVALWVRGKVIHFIHRRPYLDPLKYESLEDVFTNGELLPVWIARVHPKKQKGSTARAFRLPQTKREMSFTQKVMPYWLLENMLIFPRSAWFTPRALGPILEQGDSLVEKSLFHKWRIGYDMYPTLNVEGS
ncbi:MAG: hypothetical protein Q8P30_02540 [Candidatus Uhrbacteria bacterium]|nr:hypothetical protein [Candidatus Uhrbacteria bacterium]